MDIGSHHLYGCYRVTIGALRRGTLGSNPIFFHQASSFEMLKEKAFLSKLTGQWCDLLWCIMWPTLMFPCLAFKMWRKMFRNSSILDPNADTPRTSPLHWVYKKWKNWKHWRKIQCSSLKLKSPSFTWGLQWRESKHQISDFLPGTWLSWKR